MSGMTYKGAGVSYDDLDPFKVAAQQAAKNTSGNLAARGLIGLEWTRGESVYLVEDPVGNCYWGHVHEGLGTKNLVADALAKETGREHYYGIGVSALAVGLNDSSTLGVRPNTATMHLSVGNSDWFKNEERVQGLIEGWQEACYRAVCAWAGGETPTLKGILLPEAAELSCSVWGMIEKKENLIDGKIPHGARIVLLGSSGIHDNGLTMARKIGDALPGGYLTPLEDGQSYGEALVEPTTIYGPVLEFCQDRGVKIHYAVNITGHGWRKLMRSPQPLHYIIERVPEPHPVFQFIQEKGEVETREMYETFNMGAGYAIFVDQKDVEMVRRVAANFKTPALEAGFVDAGLRKRTTREEKKLIIEPLKLEWTGEALKVR